MIAATIDWKVLTVSAVLLLVAMILLYRLMNRDPSVQRSRYGFFVERDRYDDPKDWPESLPPKHVALPSWPDRETTAELPPKEEK